MTVVRRFIINVSSNWLAVGVRILVNFLLFPYLIGRLGETTTGVWQTVGSFLACAALLDFGMAMAIRRFSARFAALKSAADQNHLMSTSVAIYTAAATLAALALLVIARFSPSFFRAEEMTPALASETILLFYLAGALAFVRLFITPFVGFVQGLQRYEVTNAANVISHLVRLGLTILLVELVSQRLLWVGVAALVSLVCEVILVAMFSYRLWPGLRISPHWVSRAHFRQVLGFGANAFIITMAGLALTQVPNIFIGKMLGPREVTLFGVGLTIAAMLREALSGVATVFMPMFSASHAVDNVRELHDRLWQGAQVSNLVTWVLIAGIILYAEPIIRAWVGPQLLPAYWSVIVLIAGEVATGSDAVGSSALAGCGELKWLMITRVISAAIGLPLAVLAISPLNLGITGVALASALPTAIRGFWVPWYCCRKLHTPFIAFTLKSYVRPLVACAVIVAVGLLVRRYLPGDTRLYLALSAAVMGAVSTVAALTLGVSPMIRRRLMQPVLARLGFAARR